MRPFIASFFAVCAAAGCLVTTTACSSGDVPVGSAHQEIQRRGDGQPTGDGQSCSWEGTTLRLGEGCGAVPTPPGYGPYEIGETFPAPDGCNECSCTERGIMCTVRDCAGDGVACTDDAKECPDGSFVGRVPPSCEFAPCPGEGACTLEAKLCPDGSSVGRVPPSCEFAPCPGEEAPATTTKDECEIVCTMDVKECPDGSFVGRVAPDCAFAPCPNDDDGGDDDDETVCTLEAKLCPDGSTVGRVPPSCEFAPCPDEGACTLEAKLCPDGSTVGRVPPSCEFAPCPDTYDPCAGKSCGDPCTLCPPDARDCAETAVLKYCGSDGTCSHTNAACQ
jgi:hypothetical protein